MKRILTTLAQKWPEYLLEMIVITAGILGAFLLNHWAINIGNEGKIEQAYEQLLTELNHDRSQLQYSRDRRLDRINYLNQIKSNAPRDLDSLYRHLTTYWNFNPIISKYESLQQTGDLSLIEDDLLGKIVFNYERIYDYFQEWSDYQEKFINRNVEPYILANIPVDENEMADPVVVLEELETFQLVTLINIQISHNRRLHDILSRGLVNLDSLILDIETERGL